MGIRELRQDLSRYVRRVQSGERLVVTERGVPVALLTPWADETSVLDRLVAEGRARRGTGRLLDVRPLARRGPTSASEALDEQREERL